LTTAVKSLHVAWYDTSGRRMKRSSSEPRRRPLGNGGVAGSCKGTQQGLTARKRSMAAWYRRCAGDVNHGADPPAAAAVLLPSWLLPSDGADAPV
jgi:hypothetical protein